LASAQLFGADYFKDRGRASYSAGVAQLDDAAAQARDLKTQPLKDTR